MLGVIRKRARTNGEDTGFRLKVAKAKDFAQRRLEASAGPPEIETGDTEIFLDLDPLVKYNGLKDDFPFAKVEAHPATWAGREWYAFHTLTPGSWKLWGYGFDGRARYERGSIQKRNVGPVSIVASAKVREAIASNATVPFLYDVEGEGDLLCAIDKDLDPVLTSTGGAGTTEGHERCRDQLAQLDISEVQIVRDRDDAGRNGAKITARFWDSMNVRNKIIELPEEVGKGGDLRDYFAFLDGRKSRHERSE
jgi:hypothetical protein